MDAALKRPSTRNAAFHEPYYAALGASVVGSDFSGSGEGEGEPTTGVFSTSFFTRSDNCAPFDVQ